MNDASADFVRRAEDALFTLADPETFTKLRERIDRVKDGVDVILDPIDDIDSFIENL